MTCYTNTISVMCEQIVPHLRKYREDLAFVDLFTATYAPLAVRRIRILLMNQYA
jgi:hypothetical protein